jgi:N-acyl-D-amino-acid deacylase
MPGLASDGFATGQVLYFLSLSGLTATRSEVKRGITFLVSTQGEDGSWKVTPRAQPGAKPFTHPEPINSFGTAWATMALMRLVPPGK